jgi:hypothetical protein
MGKWIKGRFVALFVVVVASFGAFASAASAGNDYGYWQGNNAYHSTSSPSGGTCNASGNTPAGGNAHTATVNANGEPYFVC